MYSINIGKLKVVENVQNSIEMISMGNQKLKAKDHFIY